MEEGDIISDPNDLCKYPSEIYDLHNLYVEEPWTKGTPCHDGLVWVVMSNPEGTGFSKPNVMKWIAEEGKLLFLQGASAGKKMKVAEDMASKIWWKPLRVPAFPKNRAS